MRAVLMTAVGGPGVLELRELPEPEPSGEHEVQVRLRAAGINPAHHFDAGELRVVVGATFPLEQAADAHRALEAGQVTGKAVLVMR
jgi:NADPH:quinone reductase-like Zn-dependent oxidoreductase